MSSEVNCIVSESEQDLASNKENLPTCISTNSSQQLLKEFGPNSGRLTRRERREIRDLTKKYICEAFLTAEEKGMLTTNQLKKLDREIKQQLRGVVLKSSPNADCHEIARARGVLLESSDYQKYLHMGKLNALKRSFVDDAIEHLPSRLVEEACKVQRLNHLVNTMPQVASSYNPLDVIPQPPSIESRVADTEKDNFTTLVLGADFKTKGCQGRYKSLFEDLVTPDVYNYLPVSMKKKLDGLIKKQIAVYLNKTGRDIKLKLECQKLIAAGNVKTFIDLPPFYEYLHECIQQIAEKKVKHCSADESSLMLEINGMIERMRKLEVHIMEIQNFKEP